MQPAGLLKGVAREDLFTVVHERFMTDTALYADIILTGHFSVEQTDCFKPYGYGTFAVANKSLIRRDSVRATGIPSVFWPGSWDLRKITLNRQQKMPGGSAFPSRKGSGAAVRRTVAVFKRRRHDFCRFCGSLVILKTPSGKFYDRKISR
mgnify:CR=1 FL=1